MRHLALLFGLVACAGHHSSTVTSDTGTGPGGSVTGCDGATLLANPSDFAAPGPWAVGVKTVMVNGLRTEVWYPAPPGSDSGKTRERYDIRAELAPSEAAMRRVEREIARAVARLPRVVGVRDLGRCGSR